MRKFRFLTLVMALLLLVMSGALVSAQDEVTLTLAGWSSNPAEDAALRAALDLFQEQNPGVTVNFIPSPDHTLTMQTAFASGDYAEVFYVDSSRLPDWATAGVVAPAGDKY
ncbi:extracellular solute-binding protein [Oscillatoria laete-virens NRMC-F 0139]|nr:extracellular solute-binding protein [Oscillatoria laete-virens]MDL5054961.1 extracellular solute-binding protein [Oscillatoria laete-virens NRMC-F 0139]